MGRSLAPLQTLGTKTSCQRANPFENEDDECTAIFRSNFTRTQPFSYSAFFSPNLLPKLSSNPAANAIPRRESWLLNFCKSDSRLGAFVFVAAACANPSGMAPTRTPSNSGSILPSSLLNKIRLRTARIFRGFHHGLHNEVART
jgi:hypothetical protein